MDTKQNDARLHFATNSSLQTSQIRIAIIGKMCAGKTTLLKYIQSYYKDNYDINIIKVSSSDKVYDIAYDLFNMTLKDRDLLIQIGTKMREIDPNVWLNQTVKQVQQHKHVIIDDCRFLNEYNTFKRLGFVFIKINISEDLQLERLKITYPFTYNEHIQKINDASETELDCLHNNDVDLVINANYFSNKTMSNIIYNDIHSFLTHTLSNI